MMEPRSEWPVSNLPVCNFTVQELPSAIGIDFLLHMSPLSCSLRAALTLPLPAIEPPQVPFSLVGLLFIRVFTGV